MATTNYIAIVQCAGIEAEWRGSGDSTRGQGIASFDATGNASDVSIGDVAGDVVDSADYSAVADRLCVHEGADATHIQVGDIA